MYLNLRLIPLHRILVVFKKKFPGIKQIRKLRYKLKSMKAKFSEAYHNSKYFGRDSVSGPGSDHTQTSVIRQEIPILIKEINARSLLDAGCGDFCWIKEIKLPLDKYIGVDIVPDLIAQNQQKYRNEIREFITLNITKDNLPQVDIIICRDCLVHLSFKDIISAIRNFKASNSKYLLTTTFTGLLSNRDIITGKWRPINLQLSPFNFPKPVKLINEKYSMEDGKWSDKSLGLWRLEDIGVKW